MSTLLYTLIDLEKVTGATRQRVHDWSQRSQDKGLYIEPDYVAGRGNQHGKVTLKLWSEGQLEEVIENFNKYEQLKANRRAGKIVHPEHVRAARRQYQGNYRNRQKLNRDKPKPEPIKVPDFTPPSAEALSYEEEFHKELEDKALEWLTKK